ncbi:MAG: hypothetical protein ACREEM_51995, partial [Blastocatellia bacterium]
MFIQDNLRELKATSGDWVRDSKFKFLSMFVGVVVGPLVLVAVGGRGPNAPWPLALAWPFLAISLVLFVSVGIV